MNNQALNPLLRSQAELNKALFGKPRKPVSLDRKRTLAIYDLKHCGITPKAMGEIIEAYIPTTTASELVEELNTPVQARERSEKMDRVHTLLGEAMELLSDCEEIRIENTLFDISEKVEAQSAAYGEAANDWGDLKSEAAFYGAAE